MSSHSPFHLPKADGSLPGLSQAGHIWDPELCPLVFPPQVDSTRPGCLREQTWQQFSKRTYFFPLGLFFPKPTLGMERDAKSKKLMLPENSFLSLERMKRDVGEEVSKESLVSRKPLDFHASFSKGLRGSFEPDGQMNGRCRASCGGVSLVKWL